jgi:hypothetical protein
MKRAEWLPSPNERHSGSCGSDGGNRGGNPGNTVSLFSMFICLILLHGLMFLCVGLFVSVLLREPVLSMKAFLSGESTPGNELSDFLFA